ncbi:MAG: ATP-dependent DNA helicase [Gammaproteobacteria bacterium]|nr:ATP-dependent DNA helicase [Gammaproteobacteria bacterium]
MRGNLSVRQLAEFVFRQGDLYPPRLGRAVEPEEGIQAQRQAQKLLLEQYNDYRCEVGVKVDFKVGGRTHMLSGRMDGLLRTADTVCVEEYKCCGELPLYPDLVDWAQVWLYAGLYATNETPLRNITIRLIYIDADTSQQLCFEEQPTTVQAVNYLQFALTCYATRIERHLQRNAVRRAWAQECTFPLEKYRRSQKAIARRVYVALRNKENLLLEAPTGSGKTLAVLFPGIKSQELEQQIFFLTSRNVGAASALTAVAQIDPEGKRLHVIEISAKEKVCFVEGMPCDAQRCQYASGYFERVNAAISMLQQSGVANKQTVLEVAQVHTVCPFELSLDAALWADIVIGDYNYILDPVVRLQRFVGHKDMHLLVDEAHQLSPRTADMLEVRLKRETVLYAKTTRHTLVSKRLASIDRALLKLRRLNGEGEFQIDAALLLPISRAISKFLVAVQETAIELQNYPELADVFFACLRWQRSQAWVSEGEFAHTIFAAGRDIIVTQRCLDPGPYIRDTLAQYGGVIRFSGTLTPLHLYQKLHGQDDNAAAERARSPFAEDQVRVLVVDDVPTYYRQRQHSLPNLIQLIKDLMETKQGRYLVAFPSYAYLQMFVESLGRGSHQVLYQEAGQTLEQTQALLEQFKGTDAALLCIVMGGVLGESVDFSASQLCGVVMVGLGLPPPNLYRDLIAEHFAGIGDKQLGQAVAYIQPALVKNIQAAGRLLRSPNDRGIICLVDDRFNQPNVQRFFPAHWRSESIRSSEIISRAQAFWREA